MAGPSRCEEGPATHRSAAEIRAGQPQSREPAAKNYPGGQPGRAGLGAVGLAAGAIADGRTVARPGKKGLGAAEALARNDSYHFFEPLGDLIRTGPTGTNVMDVHVVMVG